MNRIVRLNVGGRRFDTLASTLQRYGGSVIASIAEEHCSIADTHEQQQQTPQPNQQDRQASSSASLPPTPRKLQHSPFALSIFNHHYDNFLPTAAAASSSSSSSELFLDMDPDAFHHILQFLRSGSIRLPAPTASPLFAAAAASPLLTSANNNNNNNGSGYASHDGPGGEPLRASIVRQLDVLGLTRHAFPPVAQDDDNGAAMVVDDDGAATTTALPDVLIVQMCDHMQAEQGIKRHAVTITFGSDGFQIKELCKSVRKDLRPLLSATYWQIHQTNERAAFFVSTRIANASADLLMTSVAQRTVAHAESMGYSLANSYVTLSPDAMHTHVRIFIHCFIFRRVRLPVLESSDALALRAAGGSAGPGSDAAVFYDDGDDTSDNNRVMKDGVVSSSSSTGDDDDADADGDEDGVDGAQVERAVSKLEMLRTHLRCDFHRS